MKSLFLKIFLSFWLAQALIVALVVLATVIFRPQTESPFFEYIKSNTAQQLAQAYETGGAAGLSSRLDALNNNLRIQAFLFDDQGRELTGRTGSGVGKAAEPWCGTAAKGWLHRFSTRRLVSQQVVTEAGQRYLMAAEVPPRPLPLSLREKPPGAGLEILAMAVLVSGMICYFLAGYLTADVSRLRAAAQQLAAGDLSARAVDAFRTTSR